MLAQGEKLVVVQSVSGGRKTFAIQRGRDEGIILGQKALFSNGEAALKAECTDISRFFSVWRPVSPNATIPFEKGGFVLYDPYIQNIILEIPRFYIRPEVKKRLEKPRDVYWMTRLSFSRVFSGVSSDVDQGTEGRRTGLQMEVTYTKRFRHHYFWGVGVRYDYELSRLESPSIDIPHRRYLGLFEFTRIFDQYNQKSGHYFLGTGIGFGLNSFEVNTQTVATGTSFLFPMVRMGHIFNRGDFDFILQGTIEFISNSYNFNDGRGQSDRLFNGSFSLGVRF